MKIILGTASKWRQIYFKELGYSFEVMTADIDEKSIRSDDFEELPILVARAKAEKLLPQLSEPAVVVTFDEIVVFQNKILEKPKDEKEARDVLESYANQWVETYSGVYAVNTENGDSAQGVDVGRVLFKKIPEEAIDQLIGNGYVMNCAGSFELEDPLLRKYVEKIDGAIDSIAGMPKELTRKLVEKVKN